MDHIQFVAGFLAEELRPVHPMHLLNTEWLVLRETVHFVPLRPAEGNIDIREKQNELFPEGLVIVWFVI